MKRLLESKLEPGYPITIKQAVLNCLWMGRKHRRGMAKRLSIDWKDYLRLENVVLGID